VLRLPRGTFTPYTPGTKTYVIFFTKGKPTEQVWLYDARANVPGITKKGRPLTAAHFADFENCFGVDPNGKSARHETDRFRRFEIDEIRQREYKLDGFKWIKDEAADDPDEVGEPEELIAEAISILTSAVHDLNHALSLLDTQGKANV
jgi:type I restriction enzyme M protein